MRIDIIDGRGFVKTPPYQEKLAGKPLNNAQTACSSYNLAANEPLNNAKMVRPGFSGQGSNKGLNVAQPLNPSIK